MLTTDNYGTAVISAITQIHN